MENGETLTCINGGHILQEQKIEDIMKNIMEYDETGEISAELTLAARNADDDYDDVSVEVMVRDDEDTTYSDIEVGHQDKSIAHVTDAVANETQTDHTNGKRCLQRKGSIDVAGMIAPASNARIKTVGEEHEIPSSETTGPSAKFKGESSMNYKSLRCVMCSNNNIFVDKESLHEHIVKSHITQEGKSKFKLECPVGSCTSEYYVTPAKKSTPIKFNPSMIQKQLGQLVFHRYKKHSVPIPEFIEPVHCPEENCPYTHVLPALIYEHRRSRAHTKPGYRSCQYCGAMIQSVNIQRHVKTTCPYRPNAENRDRKYSCSSCDKSYLTKHGLDTHIRRIHEDGGTLHKEWLCKMCGKEYVTENGLNEHLHQKHRVNQKSRKVHNCSLCDFTSLTKSKMDAHKLGHNDDSNLFQCNICDITFDTIYKYKYHLGKHRGPQQCPHCSFQCQNRNTLSSHIKAKHTATEKYKCDLCDFKTGQTGTMYKHRKQHERKKKRVDEMAKNCIEICMEID